MRITPVKKFRLKHEKGTLVQRGVSIDVDPEYGQTLIQTGLAVADTKQLRDYENKMLQDYANKKLPVDAESPEQRSEGWVGPAKGSETPEERNQGYRRAKARKDDSGDNPSDTPLLSEMPKSIQDDLGAYDAQQEIKDKEKERRQLEKEGLKPPVPEMEDPSEEQKQKDKERQQLEKAGVKPPTQPVAEQNAFKQGKPDETNKKR
jgi:hypothetical protein